MQIYLEQIALFGVFGQCIWSKYPKTHIKNLVESSAGNYAIQISHSSHQYIPLDFLYVHPDTLGKCFVQKNKIKQFVLGRLIFWPIIPRLKVNADDELVYM